MPETNLLLLPGARSATAPSGRRCCRRSSAVGRLPRRRVRRRASLGAMAERVLAAAPATFALAGHSMGGRVALEIVRRAPERVERLALLDTGFRAAARRAPRATTSARGALRCSRLAREQGMRAMAPRLGAADGASGAARRRGADRRDPRHDRAPDAGRNSQAQIEALLARPDAGALLPAIALPDARAVRPRRTRWSPPPQHEEMAAHDRRAPRSRSSTTAATWRRWSGPTRRPRRCCDWLRTPVAGEAHATMRRKPDSPMPRSRFDHPPRRNR